MVYVPTCDNALLEIQTVTKMMPGQSLGQQSLGKKVECSHDNHGPASLFSGNKAKFRAVHARFAPYIYLTHVPAFSNNVSCVHAKAYDNYIDLVLFTNQTGKRGGLLIADRATRLVAHYQGILLLHAGLLLVSTSEYHECDRLHFRLSASIFPRRFLTLTHGDRSPKDLFIKRAKPYNGVYECSICMFK